MDDEDLLQRARRGDREAFAEVVARYQDRLYTMALRLLGNSADAADAVQETFIRAWLHIHELQGPGLRAWLFRVTVNCSRDLQRRAIRRPHDPLEDERGNIVELPDAAQDPERTVLNRQRLRDVLAVLESLPMDLRTVLVLREINELSYEEIGDVLQIPVGTAKSRVNRARLQFSEALQRSGVLAEEGTA
ncbi:MAG: sigma-70 family RNA polymerase sigma factor [Candidatus Dormibacteraeota bacterium]|nr:sigma-70 family RNA polymerase sigma factor [Candidatus Dormibacteraeota bacterium]